MIEQYIKLAELHAMTDYSDDAEVACANRAANEMIEIAKSVGSKVTLEEFATLLEHQVAKKWAAHHLIEVIGITDSLLEKSLNTIREVADSNDPDSFGEKMWLEHWEAENT